MPPATLKRLSQQPSAPESKDSLVSGMRRGMSVMAVFTVLASAVNYASNVVFSRLLDPAGFGELTALLALALIIVVPTGAAQTVIAERVASHYHAGHPERVKYFARHAIAHVGLIALIVGVVYAACIPLVVSTLDLTQPGPAIALTPFIVLAFALPVALGVLQGLELFAAFGFMQLAIALSRIGLGVPWVLAGGGAGGAIAGQALGVAIVLVATAWLLRDLVPGRGSGAATAGLRRRPDVRTVSASMAFVAFAILSNLDLLLATLFLDPHQVGIYAAIATVGKIVLFLPMAVAVVIVPNAARVSESLVERAAVLRTSARVVALTAALAAIPLALASDFVVRVMFGSAYSAAAGGVFPIVIAGGALSMLYLLVVYSVAIADRRWAGVLVLGVALQVAGVAAFHDSPAQIAAVQACVAVAVLLVNESWFHSILRRPTEAAQ